MDPNQTALFWQTMCIVWICNWGAAMSGRIWLLFPAVIALMASLLILVS